jgi:hypothetical protein
MAHRRGGNPRAERGVAVRAGLRERRLQVIVVTLPHGGVGLGSQYGANRRQGAGRTARIWGRLARGAVVGSCSCPSQHARDLLRTVSPAPGLRSQLVTFNIAAHR